MTPEERAELVLNLGRVRTIHRQDLGIRIAAHIRAAEAAAREQGRREAFEEVVKTADEFTAVWRKDADKAKRKGAMEAAHTGYAMAGGADAVVSAIRSRSSTGPGDSGGGVGYVDDLNRAINTEAERGAAAIIERDAAVARAEKAEAIIAAHDLCHDLHGKVGPKEFAAGCAAEQRKLYGCAPDADRAERAEAELRRYIEIGLTPAYIDFISNAGKSVTLPQQ